MDSSDAWSRSLAIASCSLIMQTICFCNYKCWQFNRSKRVLSKTEGAKTNSHNAIPTNSKLWSGRSVYCTGLHLRANCKVANCCHVAAPMLDGRRSIESVPDKAEKPSKSETSLQRCQPNKNMSAYIEKLPTVYCFQPNLEVGSGHGDKSIKLHIFKTSSPLNLLKLHLSLINPLHFF